MQNTFAFLPRSVRIVHGEQGEADWFELEEVSEPRRHSQWWDSLFLRFRGLVGSTIPTRLPTKTLRTGFLLVSDDFGYHSRIL
jgi:hypothetical protein